MTKYKIEFDRRYIKDLEKIPTKVRQKVHEKICGLAANPRPEGCVKLSGYSDLYRIRVGDYRIAYQVIDKRILIVVIAAEHRKDVYRRL